ncbi:MAG TPA: hypothetical protein VFM54_20060 [Micromonosporaceae bacterium]|nr:hypothetical protein [Micromonosporaceae bacterium]
MAQHSARYLLIETRLGESLDEYVGRHKGRMSWRTMADDLSSRTGVSVSAETLRQWYADRLTVAVLPVESSTADAA